MSTLLAPSLFSIEPSRLASLVFSALPSDIFAAVLAAPVVNTQNISTVPTILAEVLFSAPPAMVVDVSVPVSSDVPKTAAVSILSFPLMGPSSMPSAAFFKATSTSVLTFSVLSACQSSPQFVDIDQQSLASEIEAANSSPRELVIVRLIKRLVCRDTNFADHGESFIARKDRVFELIFLNQLTSRRIPGFVLRALLFELTTLVCVLIKQQRAVIRLWQFQSLVRCARITHVYSSRWLL